VPLTNFERTIIEFRKMDYLLDEYHEQNSGKARLFYALGYTRERWDVLAEDLRSQHLVLDAVEVKPNPHGRKFEITGPLRGPAGEANIKSIWIIRNEEDFPRFVTAYKEDR
jgi:hypothetical protein